MPSGNRSSFCSKQPRTHTPLGNAAEEAKENPGTYQTVGQWEGISCEDLKHVNKTKPECFPVAGAFPYCDHFVQEHPYRLDAAQPSSPVVCILPSSIYLTF